MELSKLERYLVIMKVLAEYKCRTLEQLEFKVGVDSVLLKEYLCSLVEIGIAYQKTFTKHKTYAITKKGLKILSYFGRKEMETAFVENQIARID